MLPVRETPDKKENDVSTTGLTRRASAGALVLAATLALGSTSAIPAHSAAAPSATTTSVELKPTTVAYGAVSKAVVTVDTTTNGGPKPTGKVDLAVEMQILSFYQQHGPAAADAE